MKNGFNDSVMDNPKSKWVVTQFALCSLFLSCFISFPSYAQFDVLYDDDDEYYGNGHVRPFEEAIGGTEALCPEDIAFLNAVEATRVINRWYARLLVGKPKVRLSDIKNTSPNAIFAGQTSNLTVQDNLYALLLAGGYVWQQWAAEMELFFVKELKVSQNPIFTNLPVNGTIKLQQFALFFNVQYIFPRLFSWYPRRLQLHLDAGAGAALKSTNVLITDAITGQTLESASKRTVAPAGTLGAGARYQITAHILFDVTYRYIFLGKTNFPPVGNVIISANKDQANGFFIGATYQF